jgi:FkbM family methyltransferase
VRRWASLTYGLARSLLIYYATPFRLSGMRRLYRPFLGPGDLAFDVGANVGNRIHVWLHLGARVVALEPQPALFAFLQRRYGRDDRVSLVRAAVGSAPGMADLHISPTNLTVSTLSSEWIDKVRQTQAFASVEWVETIPVPVVTLDDLIDRHGRPAFCKIDVEGSEAQALRGLSRPIQALSFEYLPAARDEALACLQRLQELGEYEFNRAEGEGSRFVAPGWTTAAEMTQELLRLPSSAPSGDVYARRRASGTT